jgi:hypothetical protein
MIGFTTLGWYVGQTRPLFGYPSMALVVAMIAWEYWAMPSILESSCGSPMYPSP